MTSKNANFGQAKKLSISRFQYVSYLSVRMCKKQQLKQEIESKVINGNLA